MSIFGYPSNEDFIRTAACPVCCSMINEPCVFARCDDPYGKRMAARKSHDERVLKARERLTESTIKLSL